MVAAGRPRRRPGSPAGYGQGRGRAGRRVGFDADTFEDILERAAIRLADRKAKKAFANDIPFDLHPNDGRPAAAPSTIERPDDAATSGGEGVSGGRPRDGGPPPRAGDVQGQAGEGVGAAAEDTAGGVAAPTVDQTEAGVQLVPVEVSASPPTARATSPTPMAAKASLKAVR